MAISNRWLPPVCVLVAALAAGCSAVTTSEPDPEPSVAERLRSDVADYLGDRTALDANVRAVVVTVGGDTLLEEYRDSSPDDYYNIASVTKSILGTLVGIAVDEGLLDLDATLNDLLPQYASTMTPEVAATTLHQLLTMTGPFPDTWYGSGANGEHPDWVAANLAAADRSPGTFAYSDPGVDVVAAVLAQATGTSLVQYGRDKLFDPLEIDTTPALEPLAAEENIPAYMDAGFAWPVDPQGIHLGASLMKLRAQDLVRVGRLYLDYGEWEGRQILSQVWIKAATTAQVTAPYGPSDHYGYLWWVHETGDGYDAFLAWGFAGQLLQVVPELDLVAVVQTEFDLLTASPLHPIELTRLVDNVILPAAEAAPVSER